MLTICVACVICGTLSLSEIEVNSADKLPKASEIPFIRSRSFPSDKVSELDPVVISRIF
ncbi:hypothetical protein SDC9_137579 [bioreactor metagenome]|uniref:Uncharacterized protein n=1 Tax=bioreactor metagenome TaxID=1076179 RepID=A0A645DMY0_9ZZZZ